MTSLTITTTQDNDKAFYNFTNRSVEYTIREIKSNVFEIWTKKAHSKKPTGLKVLTEKEMLNGPKVLKAFIDILRA